MIGLTQSIFTKVTKWMGFLFTVISIFLPASVFAEGIKTQADVKDILEQVGNFILFVGGAIVVIFLIMSGISYVLSRGDEQKVTQAKNSLKWTLIGAAVIMGVGTIINTISNIITTGNI